MYHNIAQAPKGIKLRGLYVSPGRFRRQMALLHMLGYQGLSMSAALPYLRGEMHSKVVVITFDDGYRDNLEYAMPVLQHYGFSATCYVVSAAIGTDNHWDAAQLGVRKPLMNKQELLRWRDAGMEIGAHSRHHPRLPDLSECALNDEIAGSRRDLEAQFNVSVTQFCYPYGAAGPREQEAVARAGFLTAVTVQRGRAQVGSNLLALPRVLVGGHHGPHVFPLQLLTAHEDRH